MFDEEYSAEKRRLSIIESQDFHHPTFTEVDASGYDDNLPKINVLNDDCLDIILSHFELIELFRLSHVCRRWYNLCTYKISCSKYFSTDTFENFPVGWKQSWRIYPARSFNAVLSVLSLNHRNLKTLSLSEVVGLNAENLSIIGDMLSNLQELELCSKLELDEALSQVIGEKLCPNIEYLSLRFSHLKNINVLLKDARKLKFFSITGSDYDQDENQLRLTDFLSKDNPLISVCFRRFSRLHPDSMSFVFRSFGATLEYVDLSYTNLQGLANCSTSLPELTNMKIFIAPIDILDGKTPYHTGGDNRAPPTQQTHRTYQLVSMLKLMPNLRVLDLTYNYHLTFSGPDFVEILSKHCLLLEELFLGCCWIPAEKLVNLQKLAFLKRLCLDHCSSKVGLSLGLPSYDYAASFRFVATFVISHLKELEYFSLTHSYWTDTVMGRIIKEDDLFQFIKNAGPKFKGIFLTAAKTQDSGEPYDFVAKAVKMCTSLNRTGTMEIYVENTMFYNLDKTPAMIMDYFDSITPPFLQVKFYNHDYLEKLYSCDARCRYVNLPKF